LPHENLTHLHRIFRLKEARAIPPKTAAEANTKRKVMGSLSSTTPPMATITGTLSCTVAALVARRCRTTAYQST
jgi:hypothetical protein